MHYRGCVYQYLHGMWYPKDWLIASLYTEYHSSRDATPAKQYILVIQRFSRLDSRIHREVSSMFQLQ